MCELKYAHIRIFKYETIYLPSIGCVLIKDMYDGRAKSSVTIHQIKGRCYIGLCFSHVCACG